MKRSKASVTFWAALFAALLLAACTAANFSSLQSDFDRLYDRSVECRSAQSQTVDFVNCAGEEGAAMLDLAQTAQEAAGGAEDPRTRVGLLRLAGLAGWQSGLRDGFVLANAASLEGQDRCATLPKDEFGAPRDCALLEILPGLVAHAEMLQAFEAAKAGTMTPDEEQRFLRLAEGYLANTWDFLAEKRKALEADTDLDPALVTYLDRQEPTMLCTAFPALRGKVRELGRDDLANRLQEGVQERAVKAGLTPLRC